jgi:ComEC/Rec2-related protein
MNSDNGPYVAISLVLLAVLLPWWVAALFCCLWGWPHALKLLGLLGWCLFQMQSPPPDPLAPVHGLKAQVVAVVCEPAVATPRGCRFAVEVHHWTDRIDAFPGRWLVDWKGGQADQVALGDHWLLHGKLVGFDPPAFPGDWDGAQYWARRGLTQRLRVDQARFLRPATRHRIHYWRYKLTQRLADRLPGPRSALLGAVVYGDGSRLSPQLSQDFRLAGASHLLVASGTNVALLVAWLFWIGARLGWGPVRCAGLGLWLIPIYVGLTGAAPAMVRAGAMGWLALLARWTGRSVTLGRSLALGSLGVLLWDPNYLYDVGFQLSFAAVASLAWLVKPVQRWLPAGMPLLTPLSASLACMLGLMPVSLYTFHTFQPLSPLANLWLAPWVEGLLPAGLALSGLDLVHPRLGQVLGRGLDPWLWWVECSVGMWARLSPQIEVPDPGPLGWLAWLSLVGLIWLGPGRATLTLACCIGWISLIPKPEGPEMRLRWLWLGGKPACWLTQGHHQAMLLVSPQQSTWAQRMRLAQGLAPLDRVLTLEDPPGRWTLGDGWLEAEPGRLIFHQHDLCLGLVSRAGDWDGLSWALDSTGQWVWGGGEPHKLDQGQPWQLWREHRQLWIQPWKRATLQR